MTTFLLTLVLILGVVLAMGIGVLFGRCPMSRGCTRLPGQGGACDGCSRRRCSDGDCA